ncbi:hypothetical protein BKX93_01505 [Chromobacterium vaccinii]|uniref:Uncharacterized protein n=1 Tax=Chromobacterium vaccinii TaxID=1108595 RepID=A0A1D9LC05_9NEIS|nr:hypothetical protein BKX93_01505 [Chromobacterium vaccinii]
MPALIHGAMGILTSHRGLLVQVFFNLIGSGSASNYRSTESAHDELLFSLMLRITTDCDDCEVTSV